MTKWNLDCWDAGNDASRTFSIDRVRTIEALVDAARGVPEREPDGALTTGNGLFSDPA